VRRGNVEVWTRHSQIRALYMAEVETKPGVKKQAIKHRLAEEYGCGVDNINAIVNPKKR
jgi:hypothetical protein